MSSPYNFFLVFSSSINSRSPVKTVVSMTADDVKCVVPVLNDDDQQPDVDSEIKDFDYSKRSQWLRAAVLGATDGLVSISSLMMGVGAIKEDIKVMILTGFAGLVAGACSMAIGEYVSVYSQLDAEVSQMEREKKDKDENLPKPLQAALASALAFCAGGVVPLLAASFIRNYEVRLGVVVGAVTTALAGFGLASAKLGKAPVVWSVVRVLLGGWLAMAITFGFTRLIGESVI